MVITEDENAHLLSTLFDYLGMVMHGLLLCYIHFYVFNYDVNKVFMSHKPPIFQKFFLYIHGFGYVH